jgi:hypothetical protein
VATTGLSNNSKSLNGDRYDHFGSSWLINDCIPALENNTPEEWVKMERV